MLRVLVIAAVAYAYGAPSLHDARPPSLEPAFEGFHKAVNEAVAGRPRLESDWTGAVVYRFDRTIRDIPLFSRLGGH